MTLRLRHSTNPFNESSLVENYEDWYQTEGSRADRQEKSLLNKLLSSFPSAHSILEVGCGTGHFMRWFEKTRGLQALGLDVSRPMLKKAVEFGSMFLIQGNAQRLPLKSNSVDLVALITTLEFLTDPNSALKEAYRVARKGFIAGVINKNSILGIRYKRSGGPIWGNAHLYSTSMLKKMALKSIGHNVDILWCTTLWPLIPMYLPLPWGGFIGMAVKWNK